MIFGSVISIFVFGITMNYEDFVPDLIHASNLFANTVFIFVVHHSIAGIVKPVRPQISLYRIVFNSFALGCTVLWIESFLAALAFAGVKNPNWNEFPWEIQSLYNENFTSVPITVKALVVTSHEIREILLINVLRWFLLQNS